MSKGLFRPQYTQYLCIQCGLSCKKAFVLSNERVIMQKGTITYLSIYYIMFFQSALGSGQDPQF